MADEAARHTIERDLAAAIGAVLLKHGQAEVLKWVSIIDTQESDGQRGLWILTGDRMLSGNGLVAWDALGLISCALHSTQAQALEPHTG